MPPTEVTFDGSKVEGETIPGVVTLGSKLQKMEMELRMKTELLVEVKAEVMELKSAVNAEMMVLKAEVAKSRLTLTLPECLMLAGHDPSNQDHPVPNGTQAVRVLL